MNHRFFKWFLCALLLKGVMFAYFTFIFYHVKWDRGFVKGIFVNSKDNASYFRSIENFVDEGTYAHTDGRGKVWHATRMPGLLPVYGPLYYLFGFEWAHFFFVIAQVLADALAVTALAFTAQRLFSSRAAFYIAFALYGISSFVSIYNHHGRSETLGASTMVFFFYFLVKYLLDDQKKLKHLLWSGLFLGWATFIRPGAGVIFLVMPFIILYRHVRPFSLRTWLLHTSLFAAPFTCCLALWLLRNYRIDGRVWPPETSVEENWAEDTLFVAQYNLIIAWGGDIQTWNPSSEARWFAPPWDTWNYSEEYSRSNPLPFYIYTSMYNFDSLVAVRKRFWEAQALPFDRPNPLKNEVIAKLSAYQASFRQERPFHYYLTARLRLAFNFLFITRTYGLPYTKKTLYQYFMRAVNLLWYLGTIAGGLAGMAWVCYRREKLLMLFALVPAAFVFLHACVLGFIENRYLISVYFIFNLYAAYFLALLLKRAPLFSRLFSLPH